MPAGLVARPCCRAGPACSLGGLGRGNRQSAIGNRQQAAGGRRQAMVTGFARIPHFKAQGGGWQAPSGWALACLVGPGRGRSFSRAGAGEAAAALGGAAAAAAYSLLRHEGGQKRPSSQSPAQSLLSFLILAPRLARGYRRGQGGHGRAAFGGFVATGVALAWPGAGLALVMLGACRGGRGAGCVRACRWGGVRAQCALAAGARGHVACILGRAGWAGAGSGAKYRARLGRPVCLALSGPGWPGQGFCPFCPTDEPSRPPPPWRMLLHAPA